ncbi:hypothetical protein ACYJ2U_001600 [Clostridium botulinum]
MFKFDIGDKVKIIELDGFEPQVYKIDRVLTIRKRQFRQPFDAEPIYWFGDKRNISTVGLYQSQLDTAENL